MSECKSMGIKCLGPDVNESWQKFSANKKGEVRFGLAAIKGMGDAAALAIIDERRKNGPYKDIFDFAQRVNLSAVNRKAFESLALSGGFDSFGIKREQYFGKNTKGDSFLDTLLRYGQLYQAEQAEAQNSLFGDTEAVEIATPPVPDAEQWSTIDKLNKERDLVGIYISGHPLDDYRIILNNMCNTRCNELDDKTELLKKGNVTLGGIVTGVRRGITKTNKNFGIVTIEDFTGAGELALFGEDWGQWSGMLVEGYSIYVEASCTVKYKNSSYVDLKLTRVRFLQSVKEQNIERITIYIDPLRLSKTTVEDLSTLVNDNPGDTQLYISLHRPDNKGEVLMRSGNKSINVTHKIIELIDDDEALSYTINQ